VGKVKYRHIYLGVAKLDERQKHGVKHYYAMPVDNNKYAARSMPFPCFRETQNESHPPRAYDLRSSRDS
jgi:hypothetical protein